MSAAFACSIFSARADRTGAAFLAGFFVVVFLVVVERFVAVFFALVLARFTVVVVLVRLVPVLARVVFVAAFLAGFFVVIFLVVARFVTAFLVAIVASTIQKILN